MSDITDKFDRLAFLHLGSPVDDRMREAIGWDRDADPVFGDASTHCCSDGDLIAYVDAALRHAMILERPRA